jgi:hypothetical protein
MNAFDNWLKADVSHYAGGTSTICYARAAWNAALDAASTEIESEIERWRKNDPEISQITGLMIHQLANIQSRIQKLKDKT